MANNNDGIFIYTEGVEVPDDFVRVRLHPSVTVIPAYTFSNQKNLVEVELCDGLLEIGLQAFMQCTSLSSMIIPPTVKVIGSQAFAGGVPLFQIRLPDSIESIGRYAFAGGIITNFRVPPMVVCTPNGMLSACVGMFYVEISESVATIRTLSFRSCHSLRNVALPSDAEISVAGNEDGGMIPPYSFYLCTDLLQLFGTNTQIEHELKHRFDNLPIHKMVYYHSYNNVTPDQLIDATDIRISRRRSKLNPLVCNRIA